MELRLVRYFLAVADTGSVTQAARLVRVAQPSLSRQLRQLEAELGLELFTRSKGRLRLSAAGQQFVPIARDLVTRTERARTTMRSLASDRSPRLTVAAPATTIVDVIAPYIASAGPGGLLANVYEDLPGRVYGALGHGDADLAVTTSPPPGHLESRLVFRAPIWAYAPPGHRWAGRDRVGLAELVGQPLILLDDTHGTRRVFDHAAGQLGLGYQMAGEVRAPQIAHALTAAGQGVCVLSDDPRYGLAPIAIETPGGPLHIPLFAAWDPTHYARDAIDTCAGALSDFCHERYAPALPTGPGREP